jgi:hypothetical protein
MRITSWVTDFYRDYARRRRRSRQEQLERGYHHHGECHAEYTKWVYHQEIIALRLLQSSTNQEFLLIATHGWHNKPLLNRLNAILAVKVLGRLTLGKHGTLFLVVNDQQHPWTMHPWTGQKVFLLRSWETPRNYPTIKQKFMSYAHNYGFIS